jgi:hypothetical protein
MTARYRNRTEEIEAIQWTGSNAEQLRAFCGPDFDTIDPEDRAEDPDQDAQLLSDASHWVGLKPGDWVLKFADCFTATSDEAFRAGWEPAAVPPAVDRAAEDQAQIRRLGLMVDEYAAGAGALTDKLKRARDLHRETCPFAKGEAPPTAFTCGMCEVLDQPAAVLPAPADRAAVLREAADVAEGEQLGIHPEHDAVRLEIAEWLRGMAEEAQS